MGRKLLGIGSLLVACLGLAACGGGGGSSGGADNRYDVVGSPFRMSPGRCVEVHDQTDAGRRYAACRNTSVEGYYCRVFNETAQSWRPYPAGGIPNDRCTDMIQLAQDSGSI
jgi:hypothetical protein